MRQQAPDEAIRARAQESSLRVPGAVSLATSSPSKLPHKGQNSSDPDADDDA
jgi:hypothetical protein